jgi:hypothetical protein
MIKIIFQICFCLFSFTSSMSQDNGRFSLSINYGINGNFNATDYYKYGPGITFYDKNFIGTNGGAELKYRLNNASHITIGYLQSENSRVVNFSGTNNGISLYIMDFTLRHKEHIFYAGYERSLFKRNPAFKMQGGVYYVRFAMQEIELLGNSINIWERNTENAGMNELGVFVGFQYSCKIDTHFELGIQSRVFYVVTAVFMDQITLTPTLTYHFSKSKNKKS